MEKLSVIIQNWRIKQIHIYFDVHKLIFPKLFYFYDLVNSNCFESRSNDATFVNLRYVAPDGQHIAVTYLADKNGYQPTEHKDDQSSAASNAAPAAPAAPAESSAPVQAWNPLLQSQ